MKRVELASGLAGGVGEGFLEELEQQGRCSRTREQRRVVAAAGHRRGSQSPLWETVNCRHYSLSSVRKRDSLVCMWVLMVLQRPQYLKPQSPHMYTYGMFFPPPPLTSTHTSMKTVLSQAV